jgi:hypothetical protein
MALTKTQIANRKKWVKALRSGKYKQTSGRLVRDGKYCCLGVACDVSGLGRWRSMDRIKPGFSEYVVPSPMGNEVEGYSLPYAVINELGFSRGDEAALIRRNDTSGDTFLDIADTIELLTLADTEGL